MVTALLPAAGAVLSAEHAADPSPRDLTLWYGAPAATWDEALPVGNGRLGAMVFGGINDGAVETDLESGQRYVIAFGGGR